MSIQNQANEIKDPNTEEIIENNKIVLVYCWAPWCGPCREMSPIINELAEKYLEKVYIGKLNIDKNPYFSEKNNIKSIPNLLFFKNQKKVDQLIGLQPLEVLIDKLDKLIETK